jgi:hypothetical protein
MTPLSRQVLSSPPHAPLFITLLLPRQCSASPDFCIHLRFEYSLAPIYCRTAALNGLFGMNLPPPCEIRDSAKSPGRCYNFNTTTQESYWIRPIAYPGHRTTPWPPAVYLLHILVRFLRTSFCAEDNSSGPFSNAGTSQTYQDF